jgi:hypothetical protein
MERLATRQTVAALLAQALQAHGLQMRGGFAVQPDEGLGAVPDGRPVASLWMVGVVGSAFWPTFVASSFYRDGLPDPLDRWSQSIGDALAQRLGGRALYPFDGPPYHPFQQWADRAEELQPSRMLLRIHPQFGLWHAYRFALALPQALEVQDVAHGAKAPSVNTSKLPGACGPLPSTPPTGQGVSAPRFETGLCATCSGQPCLSACPVGAYSTAGFDLASCATHLHTEAGQPCMQAGCLARRACPVGAEHRYRPDHAAFHMRAFAAGRGHAG